MKRFDNKHQVENANIFKICEKLHKDRTANERQAICHYLTTKVNFFKSIEQEKLDSLAKKI